MTLLAADHMSISTLMEQTSNGVHNGSSMTTGDVSGARFNTDSTAQPKKHEGESLMVHRTQGDLLQKLRQLRLWQQRQQEHLVQDKEQKLRVIQGQERKLQHVEEYQRQALASQSGFMAGSNNSPSGTRMGGDSQGYSGSVGYDSHDCSLDQSGVLVGSNNSPTGTRMGGDSQGYGGSLGHGESYGGSLGHGESYGGSLGHGESYGGSLGHGESYGGSPGHGESYGGSPSHGESYGGSPGHGESYNGTSPVVGTTLVRHLDVNQNIAPLSTITGNFRPPHHQLTVGSPGTLLLSPNHFQAKHSLGQISPFSPSMASPRLGTLQPQNPMLLTQRIQLPAVGNDYDDELSQFTDEGSVGEIEGVQPIRDTASEDSENRDGLHDNDDDDQLDYVNDDDYDDDDDDVGQNGTLTNERGYSGEEEGGEEWYMEKQDKGNEDQIPERSFDEMPIQSALGPRTKTFEQLLDEKLQTEHGEVETVSKYNRPETKVPVKRTFLRKGEGIARFGMKEKKKIAKKRNNEQTNEKNLKNAMDETTRVTRKTAANKQPTLITNHDLNPVPESPNVQSRQGPRNQLSSHVIGPYTSIDVAMATGIPRENSGIRPGVVQRKHVLGVSGSEDSFQERMKEYDELEIVEKHELNEFELLEEAAANCSLSSNSSTVLRILGRKNDMSTHGKRSSLVGESRQNIVGKSPSRHPHQHIRIIEEQFDGNEEYEVEENVDDSDDEDIDDNNATLTKSDEDGENTLKHDEEVISVHSSFSDHGFNDSEAWDDDVIPRSPMMSLNTLRDLNTSTPDTKARSKNSPHSSTPPTSHLVTKLFPQLKPKTTSQPKVDKVEPTFTKKPSPGKCAPSTSKCSSSESDVARREDDSVASCAVKEKLQELENEIEKFREENAMLHKLREEREKELQEIRRERSLFESQKAEELEKLEKFKAEEERRLRRDKRVFEQYQKASRALPDKKEREEISSLKIKMNEIQEEMRLRESRWSAAATRYKDRITNLEKENKEMREEVKLLEKQNLELQKKDQQKARELQQYKAFERKKLTKPEEQRSKPVLPKTTIHVPEGSKEQHAIQKESNQYRTPPTSPAEPLTEQPKTSNIAGTTALASSCVDHHHDSPPTQEKVTVKEPTSIAPELPRTRITAPTENSNKHEPTQSPYSASSPYSSFTKDPSPRSKQPRTVKSVRFEDQKEKSDGAPEILPKEICHSDGKREVINPDGSRVVTFSNGTRKEISADGLSTIVTFFNGDVKQIMPDERVVYYYADAQTTHTTYPDGMQVLRFPSDQIEKHYPDGTKEIVFPDQTVKYLYQSGAEECVFADGTVERITGDGDRIVEFPNGQRETYTKLYKKREYPDGTVKTVYTDGRQETRYPSGRLRVKDNEGRVLVDTAEQQSHG